MNDISDSIRSVLDHLCAAELERDTMRAQIATIHTAEQIAAAHAAGKAEGLREAAKISFAAATGSAACAADRKIIGNAILTLIPASKPAAKVTTGGTVKIDLIHSTFQQLTEAVEQSNWIPKDHYFTNDWVSDCCDFLRNGHAKVTARDAAILLLGVFEDPDANAPRGFDWQSMFNEMTADHKESLSICGTHDWPSTLIVALRAIAGDQDE
jgi:hypothetical protein